MASLWAEERAQKVLNKWKHHDRFTLLSDIAQSELKNLITESIEDAEEYGEKRYAGMKHESTCKDC